MITLIITLNSFFAQELCSLNFLALQVFETGRKEQFARHCFFECPRGYNNPEQCYRDGEYLHTNRQIRSGLFWYHGDKSWFVNGKKQSKSAKNRITYCAQHIKES